MVREQAITGTAPALGDLQAIRGARGAQPARRGVWGRLVAAWMRARRRTVLDLAMEHEVRRYLGGRPAERGDVVAAERLMRELERRYGH